MFVSTFWTSRYNTKVPIYSCHSAPSNCDNDNLVLQYDFESGFEDSCQSSSLIQRGDTDVTLKEEGGNTVACFDGSSFMEVRHGQFVHGGTSKSVRSWRYVKVSSFMEVRQSQFVHGGTSKSVRSWRYVKVSSFMEVRQSQFVHGGTSRLVRS